ncbi:MAG: EVE domain-containing protein, partial [Alphaproteobacteria bacterium]|nr:EVE domain-containing protein [Alphaproteobacteria bacterium]
LNAMRKGDRVFFYHSGDDKAVVGMSEVVREAYPDATDENGVFLCVDLKPVGRLEKPVTLAAIKADKSLAEMVLVKNSRLSVQPVTAAEWRQIAKMGGAKA